MSLESLANELLLDLLEYFDGITVLRTFSGLNARFDQLLFQHFRAYHIDFRSLSKTSFELMCERHLPAIVDRVISLRLSDDDETPDLPELFLSHGFSFDRFLHLKSLSLYCLRSLDLMNEIVLQCRPLLYLSELNIISLYVDRAESTVIALMNNIWSLQLTRCRLNSFHLGGRCFFGIHVVCASLEYLFIENIYCDLTVVDHLIQHAPNLRCLSIVSDYSSDGRSPPVRSLSMTSLKLSFESSIESLTFVLQQLPNLRCLTLKTSGLDCSGRDWEKIIRDFVPQITVFRLKMSSHFTPSTDKDRQVDELLATYQTDFWLHEHHWYVRCDWDPNDVFNRLTLYTLPYPFSDFLLVDTIQSKSTAATQSEPTWYNRVTKLRCFSSCGVPTEDGRSSAPRIAHICNLEIRIPYSDSLWSHLPVFKYLKSINVIVQEKSTPWQLQRLLDRGPPRFSLTLHSASPSLLPLSVISRIASIRRLDLLTKTAAHLQYFTTEECHALLHSSLASYCEVLSISVKNRMVICDLVTSMPNLRSLSFQCEDDRWVYDDAPSNDEMVFWLANCLPATSFVTRDKIRASTVHVWLR